MDFSIPLNEGIIHKRYKRFLSDITLVDGTEVHAHCTNTGSMKGVLSLPQRAWIMKSSNTKRKLPYTLEILEVGNTLVGVNTHRTNYLAEELLQANSIPHLSHLQQLQREKKYGAHSRMDFFAFDAEGRELYIEVKNVTLTDGATALFPDSITERGTKHLHELMAIKKEGKRAAMLFIIQRDDVASFSPATAIDPVYAHTLQEAKDAGVELYACAFHVTPISITFTTRIPIVL